MTKVAIELDNHSQALNDAVCKAKALFVGFIMPKNAINIYADSMKRSNGCYEICIGYSIENEFRRSIDANNDEEIETPFIRLCVITLSMHDNLLMKFHHVH